MYLSWLSKTQLAAKNGRVNAPLKFEFKLTFSRIAFFWRLRFQVKILRSFVNVVKLDFFSPDVLLAGGSMGPRYVLLIY